jgi:hypothetical protein
MSRLSRDKGGRVKPEIVAPQAERGIKAERVPLSGASRYTSSNTKQRICIVPKVNSLHENFLS